MQLFSFFPQFQAMIIVLLPNLVQAYFSATADYYTWQLSERIYGTGGNESWVVVGRVSLTIRYKLKFSSL